jgi:hypothetical protein
MNEYETGLLHILVQIAKSQKELAESVKVLAEAVYEMKRREVDDE